eukprot:m.95563 g.95563  ORF g.95563 m.95563 type:complete len:578 (-) comp8606_c0_seq2:256-1989(-)
MEVCLLSEDPAFPCFHVRYLQCSILLDCAVSEVLAWTKNEAGAASSQLVFQPPRLGYVDIESLDVVCVSNAHTLLALPLLTENPKFRARILATEPTIQFGRMLFNATTHAAARSPDARSPASLYSVAAAKKCLDNIEAVSFDQKIPIFGPVSVTPCSSGYSIGSCNWILRADSHTVAYVGPSSAASNRHPRPLNTAALQACDVMICGGLARRPAGNLDRMVMDVCANIGMAVANGGCALVPCHPGGVVLDLFDMVLAHLSGLQASTVPIFFVSPAAKAAIAYANIFGHWLCNSKAERLNLPEWPFNHPTLVANGTLLHFDSLNEDFLRAYREPCVVFADHPSLRMGDAIHFLKLWRANANSAVVMIDPDYSLDEVLGPYQPVTMRAIHCPIDPRLSAAEFSALAREAKPHTLLVPAVYMRSANCVIQYEDGAVISMDEGVPATLPVTEIAPRAVIADELARSLQLQRVAPGVSVAPVFRAAIDRKDFVHVVQAAPASSALVRPPRLHGNVSAEVLVEALQQKGLDACIEDTPAGPVVALPALRASVAVVSTGTTITAHSEPLRRMLRDLVLAQLAPL